eukprot:9929-Heterococcus_DN1.PRE.1
MCSHGAATCWPTARLSVPQEERKSKLIHDQILGDDSAAGGDGGWVDSVQKKKVVHTGGKQVAEFLNMDDLKTVDDVVAERIYMEDLKRDFTEQRTAALKKEEDLLATKEVEKPKEEAKPSSGLFGGGGWRARENLKSDTRLSWRSDQSTDLSDCVLSTGGCMLT